MAQQDIIIGGADEKQGDTYFDAFTKAQANFTELFLNNTVYLSQESDLPNQTATTWSMNQNEPYKLVGSFSTGKQCIVADGSSLRGDSIDSFSLDYTGSGPMFKGTDASFFIRNVAINPGPTNMGFEFIDSVGGIRSFRCESVAVTSCAVWGEFTDMSLTQAINSNSSNAGDGVRLFGITNNIFSFDRFSVISTNPGFKGIDMGSAIALITEFNNLVFVAPPGAFGVSGLVNSGNIPVGGLGMLTNSEFLGGMSSVENISPFDIRWNMRDNTPLPSSRNATDSFLTSLETVTIISAGVFEQVNGGNWSSTVSDRFTSPASGVVVYIGQGVIEVKLSGFATVAKVGGGSDELEVRFAVNGATLDRSGGTTKNSFATSVPLEALAELTTGDEINFYVANNDSTANVEVSRASIVIVGA